MKIIRFNSLFYLMAFLMTFTFVACGSDDDDNGGDPKDTEAPDIRIEKPVEEASYVAGLGIIISGELTDNMELDTCVMSLSTDISGAVAAIKSTSVEAGENVGDDIVTSIDDPEPFEPDDVTISLSGESYSFSSNYNPFGNIPGGTSGGEYTLNITVTDAAGNASSKDITINIDPG
jgi:hypothetical protein